MGDGYYYEVHAAILQPGGATGVSYSWSDPEQIERLQTFAQTLFIYFCHNMGIQDLISCKLKKVWNSQL